MGVIKFVLGLFGMLLAMAVALIIGSFFWVVSDAVARLIVGVTVDLISRMFG